MEVGQWVQVKKECVNYLDVSEYEWFKKYIGWKGLIVGYEEEGSVGNTKDDPFIIVDFNPFAKKERKFADQDGFWTEELEVCEAPAPLMTVEQQIISYFAKAIMKEMEAEAEMNWDDD